MKSQITTTIMANEFDITSEAVRQRVRAFSEFFSESANGVRAGAKMLFTPRDVAVFRRIHELSDGSRSFDEIRPMLNDEIDAGLFEHITDDKLGTELTVNNYQSAAEYERQIGKYQLALGEEKARADRAERQLYERDQEIAELRQQIGQLQGELKALRNQTTRADAVQDEVSQLNREIGRLEAQLEMLKEQISKD